MQKNRTRGRRSFLRRGAAVFLATAALWLVWLTADPRALWNGLKELTADTDVAIGLLELELGRLPEDGLTFLDRLVIAQSPLLHADVSAGILTPPAGEIRQPEPEEPDGEGGEEEREELPPPSTAAPEDIIGKTMVAGNSSAYSTVGNVSVYNRTDYTVDLNGLLAAFPGLAAGEEGPQVLIFHSHATEAYTMDGTDLYEESDSYRTLDTRRNVVRVGAEMAAILEAAGIEVIHDTTLYDYPSYNEAYTRSGAAVAKWLADCPTLRLVIDVHRDALTAEDGTLYKTVAGTVENCAQVMMVMGSDAGGSSHPNWRVNLSLAVGIQRALTDKWATLARPVVLRTSSFNQNLSTGQILLEVGTHGNTLQEAITAGRLFARTVADMMNEGA